MSHPKTNHHPFSTKANNYRRVHDILIVYIRFLEEHRPHRMSFVEISTTKMLTNILLGKTKKKQQSTQNIYVDFGPKISKRKYRKITLNANTNIVCRCLFLLHIFDFLVFSSFFVSFTPHIREHSRGYHSDGLL